METGHTGSREIGDLLEIQREIPSGVKICVLSNFIEPSIVHIEPYTYETKIKTLFGRVLMLSAVEGNIAHFFQDARIIVFSFDLNGILLSWNHRSATTTGLSSSEAVGSSLQVREITTGFDVFLLFYQHVFECRNSFRKNPYQNMKIFFEGL